MKIEKHVQLPIYNQEVKLKPMSLLVYLSIKRYMDDKTYQACPPMHIIGEHCGLDRKQVKGYIDKLVEANYLTIERTVNRSLYTFNSYIDYHPFNLTFLNKTDLTPQEKSYLVAIQLHMKKDKDGFGIIRKTSYLLGNLINISYKSVRRYEQTLIEKGYMTVTKFPNDYTTLDKEERVYNLKLLNIN